MEKSLTRYIWRHTSRQQLWVLGIVVLSMIPYYFALDLPKQIVNGPIQGQGFETPHATQLFLRFAFDMPFFGHVVLFPGLQLERLDSVIALSFAFLALVIINGGFKLYINTYKGRLGERLLRRIRFELIDRILRFPPNYFKRVKSGEVASMVKDEIEPLGGFTADAFVQPALLGGQALTALVFIFVQHFWLGFVAFMMAVVQVAIIPRMRRRLLELGRERQVAARQLAGRVTEIIDGIDTIHAYDTSNFERADITSRLALIFRIRYDIYQWKFMVKFLNNFLAQVTPFLFYSIGGYLTIKGRIDVGQLVAVINAYKELPGPLKDLIDWDLARQDVQVKYEQVVEQFESDGVLAPHIQAVDREGKDTLPLPLGAVNLTLQDDSGAKILENVTLKVMRGETVAFVGSAASGGEALARAFARLLAPAGGKVTAGETDLFDLPEAVTGRRITYASASTYLFYGSLKDNLLYGLKHAPLDEVRYEREAASQRRWEALEAKRTGNPTFDLNAAWIDKAAIAGATSQDDSFDALMAVLDVVQLSKDVLEFAFYTTADLSHDPDLTMRIVALRKELRSELVSRNLGNLIEPFEPESYNNEALIVENLLFGNMVDPRLGSREIARSSYFRRLLVSMGLDREMFAMGRTIAENLVELFADLPPEHPFFQRLLYLTPEEIPVLQQLLQKTGNLEFDQIEEEDRFPLIRLSFLYVESRYRFGLLTDELKAKILEARKRFHADLDPSLRQLLEKYDPDRYLATANLIDNILFGKINHRYSNAARQIREIIAELLQRQKGLHKRVLLIGFDYNVGAGGSRLTPMQRMKLGMARALIRRSDYYIFNRPIAGLDPELQDQMVNDTLAFLKRTADDPGVVWVLSNDRFVKFFQRVVAFEQGSVVGDVSSETFRQKGVTNGALIAS